MSDCSTTIIIGAKGDPGAPGTPGVNGISSKSVLTASFTVPAEGAAADATVDDSRGWTLGAVVYLQAAGWFTVVARADDVTLTLQNLKNTLAQQYLSNVAPGTIMPVGSEIVAAGIQGTAGAAGSAFQTGIGPPSNGVTPIVPPIYVDIATAGGPYFYFNVLGNWYVH